MSHNDVGHQTMMFAKPRKRFFVRSTENLVKTSSYASMAASILERVEELHIALPAGNGEALIPAIHALLRALTLGELIEVERETCLRRLHRLRDDHKSDASLLLSTIDCLRTPDNAGLPMHVGPPLSARLRSSE